MLLETKIHQMVLQKFDLALEVSLCWIFGNFRQIFGDSLAVVLSEAGELVCSPCLEKQVVDLKKAKIHGQYIDR